MEWLDDSRDMPELELSPDYPGAPKLRKLPKRWRCAFCGLEFCHIGKWMVKHFNKKHTDAVARIMEV